MQTAHIAAAAKKVSPVLGSLSTGVKNAALGEIRAALEAGRESISRANMEDLQAAREMGLDAPLLSRLKFDGGKLREVCAGIQSVIKLPDPSGRVLSARELDEGLCLYQVSCPIGVIGVIFESRPDALVQISSLCLKSGNAVILKGGSEALRTNRALFEIIRGASVRAGLPEGWIGLLETREDAAGLLSLSHDVDLIIPRGSNEFVRRIMRDSLIPVLGHAEGICHIFIDRSADPGMAEKIVVDSKTQYVAACNTLETLLVHRDIAPGILPRLHKALVALGVEIRGCAETQKFIPCTPASEEDWKTEYLDLILSIKICGSLDEAIEHIDACGSRHTDGIVTQDARAAVRFMDLVDSAGVFWNASTRFADGCRYGLGAEVGISTAKVHSRGPVGLEGLVIYKWRLYGNGHIVSDYAQGHRTFTHRDIPPSLPAGDGDRDGASADAGGVSGDGGRGRGSREG
ncbi:MAG: glutamate-5-semialdehyde dehydrogenase [Spirochaetales bacterium]|jgi:glutamate-5-semialdehyde dehydrogenase|nr:glutamate-5-semialdehyde dehydrogenase [Spirochaetales bacterium]